MKLALFSRGRGRGHALADLLILERLATLGVADISVASCAEGAQTFRDAGRPVHDLDLPESPPSPLALARIAETIQRERPAVVLAHEEFSAPAAARLHRVPTIFLTDWFSNAGDPAMRALEHACEVLFLDLPDIFPVPAYLLDKTSFLGPVFEKPQIGRSRAAAARERIGLPPGGAVVGVFVYPGRRVERIAPCFELVAGAVGCMSRGSTKMVFLTPSEDTELTNLAAGRQDALVVNESSPFDVVAAACDVAITKGNRNIALDLAIRGVPTVNLSFGLNTIDDFRTRAIPNQRTVAACQTSPRRLAAILDELLGSPRSPLKVPDGASAAATRIEAFIRKVDAR